MENQVQLTICKDKSTADPAFRFLCQNEHTKEHILDTNAGKQMPLAVAGV